MFTVLIAEKEHIDAIRQENKLFFEPFLENKDLAFCCWNPAGQSLDDSVPGLRDVVGRRKTWRAVVIHNGINQISKQQNPFDVVDRSALDALEQPGRTWEAEKLKFDEWKSSWDTYFEKLTAEKEAIFKSALEHPLQKLSTWLCFQPEDYILNDVAEKQDVQGWALEILERESQKAGEKLELMERAQYKRELRLKETLRRTFMEGHCLNIARPTEVQCIALRAAESSHFNPDAFWSVHQDNEYSVFADRNMYFDKMRFLAFDLLAPSHRDFRTDYIRFLATILIFISNPMPGSALQARRLYQLETEADELPLCTIVTSYDKKLAATYEVIENEMEKIRSEIPGELSDKDAEALFCTVREVPVQLDESCKTGKVLARNDYGLFYDVPIDEFEKWDLSHKESEKMLSYIAKQQSRAIRKSVTQTNFASQVDDVNVSRLNQFQIDDIREYTDAAENEMVASIPSDMTDSSQYTARLEKESEKVKKVIARRMTRKTTVALSLICLALHLVCFLPFLLANGGTIQTVSTAIVLSLGMCGVLAVIMLISLFFLRSSVTNAVRSYNSVATDIIEDIQASMKRFSKYLSASCNVRRGHAVQNYAAKNLDEYTTSLRIRKKHQEDIRKRRAQLVEDYGDYFGDRSCCDETMSRPYDYDFDYKMEYAYPAPYLAGDQRQIEFVSIGNLVTVPSSYVTRILVRMEGIYEK